MQKYEQDICREEGKKVLEQTGVLFMQKSYRLSRGKLSIIKQTDQALSCSEPGIEVVTANHLANGINVQTHSWILSQMIQMIEKRVILHLSRAFPSHF